jgi:hypothetical protein
MRYTLLASVPVRLIVMAFPQNDWDNSVPPIFWGPFRNLFLAYLSLWAHKESIPVPASTD